MPGAQGRPGGDVALRGQAGGQGHGSIPAAVGPGQPGTERAEGLALPRARTLPIASLDELC